MPKSRQAARRRQHSCGHVPVFRPLFAPPDGFFLTHRVSPILAGFIARGTRANQGVTTDRMPLTLRLTAALRQHRHLKGSRVLCSGDGKPLTQHLVQHHVARAARRANLRVGVHELRHTFCSHLAMRGAGARAIQELAGHQDLSTRSDTCMSVQRRLKARFVCWMNHVLGVATFYQHRSRVFGIVP